MNWHQPSIPDKHLKLYEQGRAGKAKAGIRLFCLQCVGWEPSEVEACTAKGCVHFPMRNLKAQAETEAPNRAKRRLAALARGQRPPKRASANGHGAHVEGPISNATDPTRPATPPEAPARPDVGNDST